MQTENNTAIKFNKYDATGNDFILIRVESIDSLSTSSFQVKDMCHRHFGIGADGILFWSPINAHEVAMRIFNSDGQEADMCGNGARAVVHEFVNSLHSLNSVSLKSDYQVTLHARVGSYSAVYHSSRITLIMPVTEVAKEIPLSKLPLEQLPKLPSHIYYIKVGVPHLFLYFDVLENFNDFKIDAPSIPLRHHADFSNGTNVNYVIPRTNEMGGVIPNEYNIRTFERGVEGETLSCGTGILSLGAVLYHLRGQKNPAVVHTKGGIVQVHATDETIQYSGEVKRVFSGTYLI
jgi:diaminopimelate epimerase